MSNANQFQPQWASPPGDTIAYILDRLGLALSEFCDQVGLSFGEGRQLLNGSLALDQGLADRLADTCGASSDFWLNREAQYREDLAREEERLRDEAFSWMDALPLKDMVRKRWIPPYLKGEDRLRACLGYFGVDSYAAWKHKYDGLLHSVAFRTSSTYDPALESVLTWLRQGELQVEHDNVSSWNPENLLDCLPAARELTLEKNPQVFLPRLRELLAPAGVSIAVSPTPSGCSASGAVFFVNEEHAVILLSFRYLSDDHFWFTFFHECGHLALHADQGIFLEGSFAVGSEEDEANDFSEKLLIPAEHEEEFRSLSSRHIRGIYKFARKIGISPGIVVGQLQHHGIVSHRHLNRAKNRYRWTEYDA